MSKKKKVQKPKLSIAMLQESRNGGQLALRGYSYQFLYSCYLMLSTIDEGVVFHLEGIEDIDYTIYTKDENIITHIQLKYSTVRQDASFMSSVLKNFLEAYLIDKNRSFKLVYDFVPAVGNLSKLFQGAIDADARKYWQGEIEKIKSANMFWNWAAYDFDNFISKISFENIEKKSLENSVECALIEKFDITTDNINLFANSIKMFCLDKMENRGEITPKEIRGCIDAVRFDISKGERNPAHSWIRRIDFTGSGKSSDYYEGKKATPADIADNLPVSRPRLEQELKDSVHNNTITVIKSSSGQGKTSLAFKTQFVFKMYHSDAIMPHLEVLDAYTIPDDAQKKMPIRNLVIMFRQEFTSLWLDTIQSNYEFDTVTEWVEYWFDTRECICGVMENVCRCIYRLLEGRTFAISALSLMQDFLERCLWIRSTKINMKCCMNRKIRS